MTGTGASPAALCNCRILAARRSPDRSGPGWGWGWSR